MNGNCEQHGGMDGDRQAAAMAGKWAEELDEVHVRVDPEQRHDERRAHPRYSVEGRAQLLLVSPGILLESQIIDLSLGGCRLHVLERCAAPARSRVEVVFKANGIAFRCLGTVQWTGEGSLLGVRFAEMAPRRRDQLADVIAELKADTEAQLAKEAAEREAAAALAAQMALAEQDENSGDAETQTVAAKGLGAADRSPLSRRLYARHDVETTATLFLVNVGSKLGARILDLSVGGCRIRTEERFPVGIYTRTEIEFRLAGLPFRMGGVIQTVHDRYTVGIRFLDLSARKRQQVEQLIAEFERAGE
jgi:c-di-GMP-binding flagellar brake protein YcgR